MSFAAEDPARHPENYASKVGFVQQNPARSLPFGE
jgi:hypothetical protein